MAPPPRAGQINSATDSLGRELSPVRARPKSLGPSEDNSSPAPFPTKRNRYPLNNRKPKSVESTLCFTGRQMLFGVGFNLGVNVKNHLQRPILLFAHFVRPPHLIGYLWTTITSSLPSSTFSPLFVLFGDSYPSKEPWRINLCISLVYILHSSF